MIRLDRNQWHGGHDYTLHVDQHVYFSLSPDELCSIILQAWEREKPIDVEQMEQLLARIRKDRER